MSKFNKKVITSAIAATVLFGGAAGFLQTQAFAASSSSSSSNATGSSHNVGVHGRMGGHGGFGGLSGNVVQETATLIGEDASTIQSDLKNGKNLADIVNAAKGWDEATYLQKLVDAETTTINAQVTAGKLTQDQADKLESGLSNRLKQKIENSQAGSMKRGGFGMGKMNPKAIADILGMTEDEITAELKAGKSYADIASEKGMTEDQLISKLKDQMTDPLKKFVEQKGMFPGKKGEKSTAADSSATATQS